VTRDEKSLHDPEAKVKAIRRGADFSFPTADIDEMLREIERGYEARSLSTPTSRCISSALLTSTRVNRSRVVGQAAVRVPIEAP
jgi:hypothetical protein